MKTSLVKPLLSSLAFAAALASPALAAPPAPDARGEAEFPPPAIPSAVPAERGYAPVRGLRIYYEVHGPAGGAPAERARSHSAGVPAEGGAAGVDGTPVVLLHGGDPGIETSWERILPLLARTRRVIAFDQQGHGRTPDVDRPFTFDGSADDTAALLAYLHVDRADLVGVSNGAHVAIEVALRHPRLVRRLVLVSGPVSREGFRPGFFRGMARATLADMPREYAEVYRRVAPNPELLPSYFQKSVDRMRRFRGWSNAALRTIAAPALIVIGDADIVRPEHAVELVGILPHARLAILPLADHQGVVIARGPWLVPMVNAFLDEPTGRPAPGHGR
jgi:pimeloyl-ACP methyl ester carboxylesterase